MKWLRIFIAVTFVGLLVYYYFFPVPTFVRQWVQDFLPVTSEEKDVRRVFTRYSEMVMRGDPQSESIYMPNAAFLVVEPDTHGNPHGRALNTAQHRTAMQQMLEKIRSGQVRVHFSDVQCRELPSGKVRLSCKEFMNAREQEVLSLVFVNTAPHRWAVSEETRQFP